jgi:hypothetical protein
MTKIKQFEKKAEQKAQEEQNKEVTFTPVEATDSVIENPSLVLDKTEEFFKKNQKWFVIGFAALVLSIGGYFGFKYFQSEQENEAAAKLYPAEHFFQIDSLNKVLKGEGKYASAKKVAEEFSITQSGKLARLYTGVAKVKHLYWLLLKIFNSDWFVRRVVCLPMIFAKNKLRIIIFRWFLHLKSANIYKSIMFRQMSTTLTFLIACLPRVIRKSSILIFRLLYLPITSPKKYLSRKFLPHTPIAPLR